MSNLRTKVLVVLVPIAGAALVGGVLGPQAASRSLDSADDVAEHAAHFRTIYAVVAAHTAEKPDPEKALYDGAIPSMLHTLDPHSNFVDPREFQLLKEGQNGQYFGVGMLVGMQSGRVTVMHPFSGSPAHRAGIRPGDVIVAVDRQSIEKLSLNEVVDRLKGPRNTKVVITVLRAGLDQELVFELMRDAIARRSVTHAFSIRPGVGYLRLESFNENTAREMRQSLRALEQSGLQALILDLRNNPGGLLNAGVAVAERFLTRGLMIVSHRGRHSGEQGFLSERSLRAHDYPLVVIVNRYSASAAEIVAGALQDHDRAWIIGEATFGKGLVQTQYPLSDNSALLLTTAKYYTPSGRSIQRDYANLSFFDYYYGDKRNSRPAREPRYTRAGRAVYGGGGITPDEILEPPKPTPLQRRLIGSGAFFQFTSRHFGSGEARLPRGWKPDRAILNEFREFLRQQNIPFSEEEFAAEREFIERQLRLEMYTTAFSKEEAERLGIETDPVIEKAIQALPKARALLLDPKQMLVEQRNPVAAAAR